MSIVPSLQRNTRLQANDRILACRDRNSSALATSKRHDRWHYYIDIRGQRFNRRIGAGAGEKKKKKKKKMEKRRIAR